MTNADWVFAPTLDTICTAGKACDEEVDTPMTMLLPNLAPLLLTTRSGEMPPLNTNRFGSVAAPLWKRAAFATSISYQRSCDPAPPNTACDVHSAVAPPCA